MKRENSKELIPIQSIEEIQKYLIYMRDVEHPHHRNSYIGSINRPIQAISSDATESLVCHIIQFEPSIVEKLKTMTGRIFSVERRGRWRGDDACDVMAISETGHHKIEVKATSSEKHEGTTPSYGNWMASCWIWISFMKYFFENSPTAEIHFITNPILMQPHLRKVEKRMESKLELDDAIYYSNKTGDHHYYELNIAKMKSPVKHVFFE